MIPKNSPGAKAALGRAAAHVAKAIAELHQALNELQRVRHLPQVTYEDISDAQKILRNGHTYMSHIASTQTRLGLSLRSETPEEGP